MKTSKDMAMDMREQEQVEQSSRGLVLREDTFINSTKEQRIAIVNQWLNAVLDGDEDINKRMVFIAKLKDLVEMADANLRPHFYAKQQPVIEMYGAKIEPASLGTKFNFDVVTCPVYERKKSASEKAAKELKDWENYLKAIQGTAELYDSETSELYKTCGPVKTSTAGYKITLQK